MTERAILESMMDEAARFIHTLKIGTTVECRPVFDLRSENDCYVIVTPFEGDTPEEVETCKNAVAFFVSLHIKMKKITHYLFISEAWAITRDLDAPHIAPVDAPDREEIIFALVTDGETHIHRSWSINTVAGICTSLTLKPNLARIGGGRFDNLFKTLEEKI